MVRLILYFVSAATAFSNTTFEINEKNVSFLDDRIQQLTISKNCKTKKSLSCKAYSAFLKRNTVKLNSKDRVGGVNPGSIKCRGLGGTVVIGTRNRNENSFCRFDDDSYIDCGSLRSK